MAKQGVQDPSSKQAIDRIKDKDRPDEAYTTDRAVRAGRANAASGRIMVNVPNDHFGPIPREADPRGLVGTRNKEETCSHFDHPTVSWQWIMVNVPDKHLDPVSPKADHKAC